MSRISGLRLLVHAGKGWQERRSVSPLERCAAIAVIDDETGIFFEDITKSFACDLAEDELVILVSPAPCPVNGVRQDGEVRCFAARGSWIASVAIDRAKVAQMCFRFLSYAMSPEGAGVRVRVVHRSDSLRGPDGSAESRYADQAIETVVPHRGDDEHLLRCLSGLSTQRRHGRISVCFDQEPKDETIKRIMRHGGVQCYMIDPHPNGPYSIRQHFGLTTTAEFIAWQDSDDLSADGRFEALLSAAQRADAHIVGSHELRLDELAHVVRAIRFPTDVNAALDVRASHPQLFPTTIVRSDAFRRIGGLSTIRKFGSDTEFLLRAHFGVRIINVDAFLYIRRRRANSLTTASDTALGSEVRLELDRLWKGDFEQVKAGNLPLSHSSLSIRHCEESAEIVKIGAGKPAVPLVRSLP